MSIFNAFKLFVCAILKTWRYSIKGHIFIERIYHYRKDLWTRNFIYTNNLERTSHIIFLLFDKDLEISSISTCVYCFIGNEADPYVAKYIMSLSDKNIEIRYPKEKIFTTKQFCLVFSKVIIKAWFVPLRMRNQNLRKPGPGLFTFM